MRVTGCDDIPQDSVHCVLVENSKVAIGKEVELQCLEFEAAGVGRVADGYGPVVREPSFGADRGVLGILNRDGVVVKLVRKGNKFGELLSLIPAFACSSP